MARFRPSRPESPKYFRRAAASGARNARKKATTGVGVIAWQDATSLITFFFEVPHYIFFDDGLPGLLQTDWRTEGLPGARTRTLFRGEVISAAEVLNAIDEAVEEREVTLLESRPCPKDWRCEGCPPWAWGYPSWPGRCCCCGYPTFWGAAGLRGRSVVGRPEGWGEGERSPYF